MKKNIILAVISILCLSAGWLGVTGIPLLAALVPLFMIAEQYGKRKRDFWRLYGWVALVLGMWSALTTWWIGFAHWSGAVASVGINIVLFGGFFMLWNRISLRVPKALSYTLFVSGWIACELLYQNGQVQFPWLTLGNGFCNDIKLVQWYDTTGVFGGSLWVLICNVLVYEAIKTRRKAYRIALPVFILLPVSISLVRYYSYKEAGREVKVTVIQPNIDPYDEKYELSQDEQTDIFFQLASTAPPDVDYIITPETAVSEPITENDIEANRTIQRIRRFAEENYPRTQFFLGASTNYFYGPGEKVSLTARKRIYGERAVFYDHYNTVIAFGAGQPAEIYHKSRLLIGVEMTPYYKQLKNSDFFTIDLGGITGQLGYDQERKAFLNAGGICSAGAVCWEGVFGEYYGGFIKAGAQVMFIMSNDGWWRNTQGHRQLFLFSRLRAVETRRSIARSANTGVSGFINQRGDVLQKVGWDVRTALTDTIVTNDKLTFYTRYGDYIGRLSAYVFLLCLLYSVAYCARRKNRLTE